MKIAIIGCGYVGSAIADKLHDHEVVRITRTHTCDATSPQALKPYLHDCDIIILTVPEPAHSLCQVLPATCKQVLFVSSTSVNCNRSIRHANAEELLKSLPITVCIFRCAGIFGPGREIAKRIRPIMPGTGKEVTNHIHVDDIASAFAFAIDRHLSGVFNLCNDDHPTRAALYGNVVFDPTKPLTHGCNQIVDNRQIKAAGFCPKHPLE